jgi:hypothetical protein
MKLSFPAPASQEPTAIENQLHANAPASSFTIDSHKIEASFKSPPLEYAVPAVHFF